MANLGCLNIDLGNADSPWGNIRYSSNSILIGMYEDGEIARSLFFIDKKKAEQLGNLLVTLSREMEE